MAILSNNKKARFDYHVLESFQAGLSLSGKMVKEVRNRRVNCEGLFVVAQNNRLEIINFGNEKMRENVPLLLKKREIDKIQGKIQEKGITAVVLNLKTVGRWIKAEIGIVKGKKKYDKREDLKKKTIQREMEREIKR
jgi:SsrA-binding protein